MSVWAYAVGVGLLAGTPGELGEASVGRFVQLALDCVHKEYPNKIGHVLNGPEDVGAPRQLTPAFFGCYDWHSSVHGHWLLARAVRLFPGADFAGPAKAALAKSLTPENVAAEVRYLLAAGRVSFERPYGLAWLLALAQELREAPADELRALGRNLAPLEAETVKRLSAWLPKLSTPVRSGEHSQTAFALGLALDWARSAKDVAFEAIVVGRARAYFGADTRCPLAYEPSGEDFLSPCLAEADLMRRVLTANEYSSWLTHFLPAVKLRKASWIAPAIVTDPSDPKLAHLDGLNLSRAWMLEGMASVLGKGDARREAIAGAAAAHALKGLAAVTGEHYEGGHWLGTFAMYLVTQRGIAAPTPAR